MLLLEYNSSVPPKNQRLFSYEYKRNCADDELPLDDHNNVLDAKFKHYSDALQQISVHLQK